jgi:hypothetical protein
MGFLGVVVFSVFVGAIAVTFRELKSALYWSCALSIVLMLLIGYALADRSGAEGLAGGSLVVALPLLVACGVARATRSTLWPAAAVVALSWLASVFVGFTIGVTAGLIPK